MKRKLNTIALVLSLIAALLSLYSMAGSVRTVDIITLFFSGFGVGATVVNYFRIKKDTQ